MSPNIFTNNEEGDTGTISGIRPRQPDKYYGQRDFLLLGNWQFSVDQYFTLTEMPVHKCDPTFFRTLCILFIKKEEYIKRNLKQIKYCVFANNYNWFTFVSL